MAEESETDLEYRAYCAEIDAYEREFKPWETRGKKIIKLYKDADNTRGNKKRFNVLWSNVKTLKPALYARDPQPVAERRFKDADPVGRMASEVLERCISYTLDCQHFGEKTRLAVDDVLLPGRGVLWWRYKPEFGDSPESDEAMDAGSDEEGEEKEEPEQVVTYEQAIPDYVHWEDFGHNVARNWNEVWLVWRKTYKKRAELVERFGDEIGNLIPLDYKQKNLKDESVAERVNKACIYEAWDSAEKRVVFLSKSYPKLIDSIDEPLTLTGTFPCAQPLYSTVSTDSLVPVPDYALYQTQAQEIENLTARIDLLQKALKVAGVYDSSAPGLEQLLDSGYENKLIPVDEWAAFAEKGGLQGSIDFLPIKEIIETLTGLYEAREQAKKDLYELTGLSDIIRGNSDPRETAKAQQIKSNFAVLRISDQQQDIQRFARDNIRIAAEIIAEHFDLSTIQAISGVKLLSQEEKQQVQAIMAQYQKSMQAMQMAQQQQPQGPPPQPPPPPVPDEVMELMGQPSWEEVYELISNQVLREFRIDIETDSTIRTDDEMERKSRTEFLDSAGQYIRNVMEAVQMTPQIGPLVGELLMFGVRSHRAGRQLEPLFEDAIRQMKQPQGEKPDPEIAKAKGELDIKREEMQLKIQQEQAVQEAQAQQETQRQQIDDQRAERDSERAFALAQYEANLKAETERQIFQAKHAGDMELERLKIESQERIASRKPNGDDRPRA